MAICTVMQNVLIVSVTTESTRIRGHKEKTKNLLIADFKLRRSRFTEHQWKIKTAGTLYFSIKETLS